MDVKAFEMFLSNPLGEITDFEDSIATIKLSTDDTSYDEADECVIKYDTATGYSFLVNEILAHIESYDITSIAELLECSGVTNYKERYENRLKELDETVKRYIRNKIKYKGEFVNDKIENDTYSQARRIDDNIFFIVIKDWWDKIDKPLDLISLNDNDDIYVAA